MISALLAPHLGCRPDTRPDHFIDPGRTMLRVETFDIRGIEQISENDLRSGLATQKDPGWRAELYWVPFLGAEPQFFSHLDWRRDIERIRNYYHTQGYYNVEILSETVLENRQDRRVRLFINIDEGQPIRTSNLRIDGLELVPHLTQQRLLENQPLRLGTIFRQQDYLATKDAIQQQLRRAGHAYASVAGQALIYPEDNSAEIYYFVDPGPMTTFGPIHLFGLDEIPEYYVHEAVSIAEGSQYSPERLLAAQEDVYDLGVFSMVTVLPAHEAREMEDQAIEGDAEYPYANRVETNGEPPLEDAHDTGAENGMDTQSSLRAIGQNAQSMGTLGISDFLDSAQQEAERRAQLDTEVPVVVRLKEAKMWSVRVGAGVAIEEVRQDVHALFNWSSRNFFGGLRRLEHFNSVGYAWAPGIIPSFETTNNGIILASELRFTQPRFFERLTNLRLRARVERDVREGFSVWNPSIRFGLDRTFFRHLLLEANYNISYFNYSNINESLLDPSTTTLGLDFRPSFMLEYLEQALTLDYRNDPLDPTQGFRVRLSVQEASRYIVQGDFDYIKPVLSGEGYIPFHLGTRGVLAIRSRLGAVYDIGRESSIPVQSRLYSGGKDGMRSFGRRRLSYFTPTGEPIPIGGMTQFETSVEPRLRLASNLMGVGDLWGAIFLDSASILSGQLLFNTAPNQQGVVSVPDVFSSLLYGVGMGAWWVTPLGPVRLDFAYTLSDISDDDRFRRCANPETIGTDQCTFVPVDQDPIQELISGYGFYISIGHSF